MARGGKISPTPPLHGCAVHLGALHPRLCGHSLAYIPTHYLMPHRGNLNKGLLLAAADTLSESTAECKKVFSALNKTAWIK